ncbi:7TM diverse intracellular signaling domain-containing protein [Emticicia sp. SJ17W-69]|uniref:sensor histidine kinase n=1 Tax=Emticicia sp. SJ17W-69 TaxID=3421657 RepID=UPI003EB9511A
MRKLLILSLLANFHLGVYAQNEVFRIDSIPQQGILLDKGWKFHVGDNPDFAKPDFDDSEWSSIDPTQDVMDLIQCRKSPIIWLRLRLLPNNEFDDKFLALIVKQTGASEIYLNGKLIHSFGHISERREEVKGYDPMGEQISLPLKTNYFNCLAVRFAYPNIFLVSDLNFPNPAFKSIINIVENAPISIDKINSLSQRAHNSGYIKTGIFLFLSLFHLLLFFQYKHKKANLYFGIYTFVTGYILFSSNIKYFINDLYDHNLLTIIHLLLSPIAELCLLIALYYLLELKKDKFYNYIIFCFIVVIPTMIYPYKTGQLFGFILTKFFLCIYIPFISFKAYRNGKKEAISITIAAVMFLFGMTIYIFIRDTKYWIFQEISFDLALLSIPFAISYILATEYKRNYLIQTNNLKEFQRLAQEKQENLQKQNAELQAALLKGQTIERQRVALDLHDNLGSTLSALWLNVDMIDKSKMNDEEKEIHQNLRENLEKAYNDVRLLSHNLLPEEFEKQGLVPTLQGFVRKISKNAKIRFDLHIAEDFGRVDNKIEFELYSICLELVNNIIKHSKATEAKISLSRTEKQIELIVSDNGIGTFNNESDGKGMKNVKARVESLNGIWNLQNIENKGVRSEVLIPI